jgi:ribonuclease P protein component
LIWRIRDRGTFARLSRDGRRVRAGALWCTYVPDPSLTPPHVAFAIGRAVGPAVVRNQVRRRLRALLSSAALPPGAYLVGGRSELAARSWSELTGDVALLVERIGSTGRTSAATPSITPSAAPTSTAATPSGGTTN